MTDAYVTVVGNVTATPVFGTTKTGDAFASFRVAVNHGYFDRDRQQWLETGASFYKVSAFRALAVNAFESLQRGTPVLVHGKLRVTDWENGDKQGTEAQIKAVALGPNLSFGQADFTVVRRNYLAGDDPMEDENVRTALDQASDAEDPADLEGPTGEGAEEPVDQEPAPEEQVPLSA